MKVKELVEYLNTLDGDTEVVNPVYDYDMFYGYEEVCENELMFVEIFMNVDSAENKHFYVKDGFSILSPDGCSSIPDDAIEVKAVII